MSTGFRVVVLLLLLAVAASGCARPAAPSTTAAKGNAYVNLTADPYYRSEKKADAGRLLVEFGVAGTPALPNITLQTDQPFASYERGFGIPRQKDIVPPEPAKGSYTVASGSKGTLEAVDSQTLTYKSGSELVTNFASLYIYLESEKPIKVVRAEFNGQTFELVEGKLVPRQ